MKPRIVATIGPASEGDKILHKILPKVAIARMNMSHGSYSEHKGKIDSIREISPDTEIMIDLQGPKIRLGKFPNGAVHYHNEERTHLIYDLSKINECDKEHLYVSIPQLIEELDAGDEILFNDGYIGAKVLEKRAEENRLYIQMTNSGSLSSNKGVNTSTASLSIDPLTEKDLADLEFGLKQNPEYIAISFVRSGDDVRYLRSLIEKAGSKAKIVVKVERHEAIDNLDDICKESDVVMIARGDLGVEVDLIELPYLQQKIIKTAKKYDKKVIWATQVLESMINCPRPTRAEVTDVHTAIVSGADYTMLSGESAMGDYVKETINFMDNVWKRYS